MTFKDIAFKNLKFNIRKYFAYFLCSSFAITVLFIFSTLLFNDEIVKEVHGTPIYHMMKISFLIVGIFSFFFISYAHVAFMKSRSKEFGLFLTLGMMQKDISRLIKIENNFIILVSLIFGLLSGTIVSRLFFMIVIKILQLKGINYILNYKSYTLSIGVFLLICAVVMFIIKTYIRQLEITELLKNNRQCENSKVNKPILGFTGLFLIIVSFPLMFFTMKGDIFKHQTYMYIVYVCMCLIGTYFAISEFGSLNIKLYKKNIRLYFKNIISLNEINHKFNQYKKILYIVSILSGAAIFLIGLTFGIYTTTKDKVTLACPYDIMYIETLNKNKLSYEKLKEVVEDKDNPLHEIKKVDFITMELYKIRGGRYILWDSNHIIFSESEINKILKETINVEKGKVISSYYNKELNPNFRKGDNIKLKQKDGEVYEFTVQQEIYGTIVDYAVNYKYTTINLFILNDEDYKNIVNKSNNNDILSFHLLNFKDWKNSEDIFNSLISALKDSNGISKNEDVWNSIKNYKINDIEWLRPVSKLENYNYTKKENTFCFFVMSFIGLLFLLSSGVVLYFKIYTGVEDARERYKRLFKLGIKDDEMKKVISKELKPIFFIPVILGSVVGVGYISVLFVNYSVYKKLVMVSVMVALIYLVLQIIFYFVTRNKYLKEILA